MEILIALFGAGGLTSLGVLIRASQSKKESFNKARAAHIEDLDRWRKEAQEALRQLQEVADYWRRVAADFEHQLRTHGIIPETTARKPDSD